MRWLIMLFLGMALGAGALFTYLRAVGEDAEQVQAAAPAPAPVQPAMQAAPPPPAPPAPAPADTQPAANPSTPLDPNAVAPNPDPHLPSGQSGASTPAARLLVPVQGVELAHLNDTFNQPRGQERRHEALDIMAPQGTAVVAAADGRIAKLFDSKPGGLTVYQFDPSEKFSYYYAHLERYADNLKEGQQVKRGDVIGYVGVTGNSDPNAPHLHFAVFELPPSKEWWKGKPVNPYPLLQQ